MLPPIRRSRLYFLTDHKRTYPTCCRMSVHAAMEWLLLHPEGQSPPTPPTDESDSSTIPTSTQTPAEMPGSADGTAVVRPKKSSVSSSSSASDPPSTPKSRRQSKAQSILESFRAYKRRKFKPNLMVGYGSAWLTRCGTGMGSVIINFKTKFESFDSLLTEMTHHNHNTN